MSDKSNSKFPEKADVVIVGVGGIVGSMLAYWLAELGQKNIVGFFLNPRYAIFAHVCCHHYQS